MTTPYERSPSLLVTVAGVLLLVAVMALAAIITITLVPLRVGGYPFPIAVVLALASNVLLPRMASVLTGGVGAPGLLVAVWVVLVLVASQATPDGDVLLPGGSSGITYVVYATMITGLVGGLITVVSLGRRPVTRPPEVTRPPQKAPSEPQPKR